jgi:hypothetical protein
MLPVSSSSDEAYFPATDLKGGALAVNTDHYHLHLYSAREVVNTPTVVHLLNDFLNLVPPISRLYVSSDWIKHLDVSESASEHYLALLLNGARRVVGASIVTIANSRLQFDVHNKVIGSKLLAAARLPEGSPVLIDDSRVYSNFLECLLSHFRDCDCIWMTSVPTHHPFFRFLQSARDHRRYMVYIPDGERAWHKLHIRGSFERFLSGMGNKARYNLRRTVKRAHEKCAGDLRVHRVESQSMVADLLDATSRIGQHSWQARALGSLIGNDDRHRAKFEDLADRRLLRAYYLTSEGVPCAFAIGYQFEGVFHLVQTEFDDRFAELSPGTVLLYYVIEDLHNHRSPTLLNFGIGDATYKRRFADQEDGDAAVLCFRPSLRNFTIKASHASFQAAIRTAKRLLGRRVKK